MIKALTVCQRIFPYPGNSSLAGARLLLLTTAEFWVSRLVHVIHNVDNVSSAAGLSYDAMSRYLVALRKLPGVRWVCLEYSTVLFGTSPQQCLAFPTRCIARVGREADDAWERSEASRVNLHYPSFHRGGTAEEIRAAKWPVLPAVT